MFSFVLASLSVLGLLILWFQTTAVLEYGQAFGLGKWLGLPAWIEARKTNPDLAWLEWIKINFGVAKEGDRFPVVARAFFLRGLSCPYCVGVWLSIAAALVVGHLEWSIAIYGVAILLYRRA